MTQQMTIQQAIDAAVQHHQAGRLQEAESIYRQVLTAQPEQPDALHLLGLLALKANQPKVAVDFIRRATAVNPAVAQYHNSLGQALAAMGTADQAIQSYRLALALKPDLAEAHNSLGIALRASGKAKKAIESFNQALHWRPDYTDARTNLGNAQKDLGQLDEAIQSYRQALVQRPDDPAALNNLAGVLQATGSLDEAIELYQKAVAARPGFGDAWVNLGITLQAAGRFDEARSALDRALVLVPDGPMALYGLAVDRLLHGDFEKGWDHFESRIRIPDAVNFSASLPEWDGSELNGRRILILPEQGFGDVIHFARYASMLTEKFGGRVVLGCSNELMSLMKTMKGIEGVTNRLDDLFIADVEFPLLSLPRIFKTDSSTIPASVPYLSADPTATANWKERLASHDGLKVGLVWAGRPTHRHDRARSIPLRMFEPIGKVPNVQLISLQKGHSTTELRESSLKRDMLDWTTELNDFADTAALIDNLDLVIAVDTAVAHLAGAMGKPVWLLLPFSPDWRWMLGRDDSPWYPMMRLFRQPKPGDWQSPIQSIASELRSWRK